MKRKARKKYYAGGKEQEYYTSQLLSLQYWVSGDGTGRVVEIRNALKDESYKCHNMWAKGATKDERTSQ